MTRLNQKLKIKSQISPSSVGSNGGKADFAKASTAKATTMAELMAKHQSLLKSYKKGDTAQGTITKLTASEILVDIGAKTEAVVLEKDKTILHSLLNSLKIGDRVNVSVLNPESDQGNPVVSLRRFIDERLWAELQKLKDDEVVLEVVVTDITKGGFLVQTPEGMSGFLPNSQTILSDNPQSFIGKKIKTVVLEINRSLHKIIFSQKAAVGEEDFSKATSQVKSGETVDAQVSSTTPFGVFVSVNPSGLSVQALEGFIHLSELSWDRIESAENYFKVRQTIKAQVIGVDKDAKRINLSVKRLTKDPFEETARKFPVDKKVRGIVRQVNSQGLIIDIEGIEGLIKKEKVPPSSAYSVGDEIEAVVSGVDTKRHRVILTPVLKEKPIGYR